MAKGRDWSGTIAAAKIGDDDAWRRIYSTLAGPIRGFLVMRGTPDPDDVLGEIFVDIARNIATFEGDERHFRAWAFTIAHHRRVDAFRATGRRPSMPYDNESLESMDHDAGSRRTSRGVEELVVGRLSIDEVQRMVAHLAPDQQDVIRLKYLGGLTLSEVAAATGKKLDATKAVHRRALLSLRRMLAALDAGPPATDDASSHPETTTAAPVPDPPPQAIADGERGGATDA